MNRARMTGVLAAAGLSLLALTGCAGDPSPYDEPAEPSMVASTPGREVTIETISGRGGPDDISILCVDGSAFLYVYTSGPGGNEGGPAVSRFPEQDATCSPEGAEQTAPSKEATP